MRVLIATVTAGAGHLQAAAALEESWRALRPKDQLDRLDVLDFTPRLYRKVYIDSYIKLVEHAPELWGHLFKRTDNPALSRRVARARQGLAKLVAARFIRHLKKINPDAVLCTHFMPLEILAYLRARPNSRSEAATFPFQASIVTDFEAHALWMDPGVDLYCVAADETKARLVARGVPESRIAVTGIPIASKFSQPMDATAIRKRLGLRDDLPVILVLGGGFGMGPVKEILAELNKTAHAFQTMVVCGRNLELRREAAALDHTHPTHVYGYVSNMHELLAISDLLITKPGGLTTSEALAMGKPIFVLNPIPGQEAANSDYLLERGAAVKANRVEDLPFRLEKLLGSPKLETMAAAARALGRPNAAKDVCRAVLERIAA